MEPETKDYCLELIEEATELNTRTEKLKKFMDPDDNRKQLGIRRCTLITAQLHAMELYGIALHSRIQEERDLGNINASDFSAYITAISKG